MLSERCALISFSVRPTITAYMGSVKHRLSSNRQAPKTALLPELRAHSSPRGCNRWRNPLTLKRSDEAEAVQDHIQAIYAYTIYWSHLYSRRAGALFGFTCNDAVMQRRSQQAIRNTSCEDKEPISFVFNCQSYCKRHSLSRRANNPWRQPGPTCLDESGSDAEASAIVTHGNLSDVDIDGCEGDKYVPEDRLVYEASSYQ